MKLRNPTDPPLNHTLTFRNLKAHCSCGWEAPNTTYDSGASHKRAVEVLETISMPLSTGV